MDTATPPAAPSAKFKALLAKMGAVPLKAQPKKQRSALAPYLGQYLVLLSINDKNHVAAMTEADEAARTIPLNTKQAGVIRRAWGAAEDAAHKGTPLAVQVVRENKEFKLTEPAGL